LSKEKHIRKAKRIIRRDSGGALRFSVIIPTKNEEKLLSRCLDGFSRELKDEYSIEIVVSDGGSSDATIGIAAAFADKIATHEEKRRQTIAEGRNRGAAIATGDVLIFLNADSFISKPKEFFERIRRRFLLDPSLLALAVKVEVDPDDRKLSDTLFHGFFNLYVRIVNWLGIGLARGECQIVRRQAFNAINGYDNSLPAGEDFEFYKRLKSYGKVRFDNKLLVYESPRRYRKYGYLKVYKDWTANALSVLFTKHAACDEWEEVR
jgi:glycosyltransferase involved in cell wall biosynthesis